MQSYSKRARSKEASTEPIMLSTTGDNYDEWRQHLSIYFQNKDGIIGTFLIEPPGGGPCEYVQREGAHDAAHWQIIANANPDFTPGDMQKLRMDDIQARDKVSRADNAVYHQWWGKTLSTLSRDHQSALAKSAGWAAIAAARKPLALIELVRTAIVFKTAGLAPTTQADVLFSQWEAACKQGPKESLLDYARRCTVVWKCLVAANHPQRGDEATAIRKI